MKRYLPFALVLSLIYIFTSFTPTDPYKDLLKKSAVCIHMAQKQMIANQKLSVNGKLAKAVLLQSEAVNTYHQKQEAKAACYSLAARSFASQILKELSGKENNYTNASAEEEKLAGKCGTEEALLSEAAKTAKNGLEKDENYSSPQSLNDKNIDIK